MSKMYYVDSQRTTTRRDSSLILTSNRRKNQFENGNVSTAREAYSTSGLTCDSNISLVTRSRGSIRKELVTIMFESMLSSIVDTWESIEKEKRIESAQNIESEKNSNEVNSTKKKKILSKPLTKKIKSKSKMDDSESVQPNSINQVWWSSPDERALIRFHNGNIYEGDISMKCMHGQGRFQWADGTVYMGQFKNNEICGRGCIQWKDDTWYEGEFVRNIRHGHGLYVDSRRQRSYTGNWCCGAKHGKGVIHYSKTFDDSYDGDWIQNVWHGYGSREYCHSSGYQGEWNQSIREGEGLMIWPNNDFYRGQWVNGVMSGYGIYIWGAYYNNTMSHPSINAYRGYWERGERSGHGFLNMELGLALHYQGEFRNNMKNGAGTCVTSNGVILRSKKLFIDDNLVLMKSNHKENEENGKIGYTSSERIEPIQFEMSENAIELFYHIKEAFQNIDRQEETRNNLIEDYIQNNRNTGLYAYTLGNTKGTDTQEEINITQLMKFEEMSMRNALRYYQRTLKNIYYTYATNCNTEEINFTPILKRLYLWQFYFDCDIQKKGLNLVEIDHMFHKNPEWLSKSPHNPFEKIYYWQFLHSLISVSNKLYSKRHLPTTKPDTILANAFGHFMEMDVLPNVGSRKGRLVNYGNFVPMKALYNLYRSIGEPHTIRTFLCAVRKPLHNKEQTQALLETFMDILPIGRNVYVFGEDLTFVIDEMIPVVRKKTHKHLDLKLFNFGNLSCKTIVKIFSKIFPHITTRKTIKDLSTEITFYEFLEAFLNCTEESIRRKEEEIHW